MEKKYILPKNSDYKRVTKKNESFGNKHLILYSKRNNMRNSRYGITITKKVGNAVTRNKIRRRMKAILRELNDDLKDGYDYVFIIKCEASVLSFDDLKKTTCHLLKKAGAFEMKKDVK